MTKKTKSAPVAIKGTSFADMIKEAQRRAEAEAQRRAAMTPAELAEQERKDVENEKEIEAIIKQLPGLVRIGFK